MGVISVMQNDWIIVAGVSTHPIYWTGRSESAPDAFSADQMKAVRFARSEDAFAVATGILNNVATRVDLLTIASRPLMPETRRGGSQRRIQ